MPDHARTVYFPDATYDGQFTRTMTAVSAGAGDLGAAFATARRIPKPDHASWYEQWTRTADRTRVDAEASLAAGHTISARTAFLSASEYYRQAFYFVRTDLDDQRLHHAYAAHVDTFESALPLLEHPAEPVRIPYDDTTVQGYFFRPGGSDVQDPRPTLLFPAGYDSTAAAGWVQVPDALARGYNVLTFEGPGQGEALYVQRLYFRPDYEHVLRQAVDWLVERPEVDPTRIGLVGRSFAGYLAPRGATAEHRLAALVCDPAQPDMAAHLPSGLAGRVAAPAVTALTHLSAERAEFFGARMAAHGVRSAGEYFDELRRFTMLPDAGRITCPVLVIESEGDPVGGGGQTLVDALTSPATLVHLTAEQGAGGHCAGLGQVQWARTVYDWLDDTLTVPADAERAGTQPRLGRLPGGPRHG